MLRGVYGRVENPGDDSENLRYIGARVSFAGYLGVVLWVGLGDEIPGLESFDSNYHDGLCPAPPESDEVSSVFVTWWLPADDFTNRLFSPHVKYAVS